MFTAALLLTQAGPVAALSTLPTDPPDTQESAFPTSFFAQRAMAQTFTPQHNGSLTGVALRALTAGTSKPTVYINIWGTTSGKPSLPCAQDATNPLTTVVSLQTFGQAGWQYVPLAHSVQVTAGTRYAIVACTSTTNQFMWQWENAETYSGGDPFLFSGAWGSPGATVKAFDFMAWVPGGSVPAPNQPPTLGDVANVQAPEGTAPTNTGTYSDADTGDTVQLSATPGSVTKTGTNSGTWTWTGTAADEDVPAQPVTITANDGHNPAVSKTFTVSFFGVAPTVTVAPTGAAGPQIAAAASINEGTPLSFTGSAHSAWAGDNTALAYAWTVTKDGTAYPASGPGTAFSFTPNDEGSYVVTLAATDGDTGKVGSASYSVTVADVLPTAIILSVTPALTAPKILLPYETVTFSGTFTDPGTGDPHTATWNFGDGSSASGWTPSHYYTQARSYTVTLTVAQGEDSGVGTATWTVKVMTPAEALSAVAGYVQGLPGLNAGQKNSLIVKLNAAADAANRGNTKAAANQLNAFLNELQADVNTGKVSSAEATHLQDDIRAIKGALGNYNRLLDFWPLGL